MKKLIMLSVLFLAPLAQAETTTYKIAGMHCGGCVSMIKSTVCGLEGVDKCEVSIGKVVISPKTGITITDEQIKAAVSKAGDYKVTGSKVSK